MTLSELLRARVYDTDGRRIGRVVDARATNPKTTTPQVQDLLVGRAAFLRRMGLRREHREVRWSDVVRIEGGRIVVRIRVE